MQNINKDIKSNCFKRVYLLYGEEAYLKKSYKKKLIQAIIPEGDTMNFHAYEGKSIPVKEIIDLAETMPFFSEYRLILMENTGFFKTASEEMAAYIKEVPENTILLFVEEEVDKRNKLFKSVKDKGYACELTKQTDSKLITWLLGIMKKDGKKIKEEDMKLFLSKTGNDMENIYQEWLKLSAYTEGREEITKGDIEEICSAQISGKIFEMIHAISERKQKKALEYYYDLLTLKEPPMRILFLIAREYNLLLQVKQLEKEGKPAAEIAKITKLQGFLVGKYISQAKQFSVKTLKETLAECVETEEAVKTGQLDGQLGVELLIIKFSTKKQESFEEEK